MDPSLSGLDDLLVGALIGAAGLLALVISVFRRRGIDPLLASFGTFALLFGIRQIVDSDLIQALGVSIATERWVSSFITYIILIPAWYFFWKLLGDGWHSLVLLWLKVVTVFAVVGITSDLLQQEPGTMVRHPNNLIVLLGLIVAALSLLQFRGRMTRDLRILSTGLAVFGLFSINDNLVSMGLLPWSTQEESIGFLFFMGCLFWIAVRHFFSTERNLAAVAGELEAARRIQTSILPEEPPHIEGLSIAVRFLPSSAVAGDLYDFTSDSAHRLAALVADVSGHGIPAALIASMVKIATTARNDFAGQPARLLGEVNRTLCGNFKHGFVTAAYVHVDLTENVVTIASAGHPYPLLCRDGIVREVGGSGTILGRFPGAEFHEKPYSFEPGDRLVLYTDGIIETRNPSGEMFGEERLTALIRDSALLTTDDFLELVLEELRRWTKDQTGEGQEDDLTLVVVDRTVQAKPLKGSIE